MAALAGEIKISYSIDKSKLQTGWNTAMSALVSKGFTEEEAAGILANLVDAAFEAINSFSMDLRGDGD